MVRSFYLLILSAFLLLVFVGCGVPYKAVGSSGGHSTVPISNDQFEVTYLSNRSGGQPTNRMQELTLLRAAEVTLKYGFTHFVVEEEIQDAKTKWKMKSTTSRIGGISSGGGGLTGSPGSGISIGSPGGGISPGSGISIGSPGSGTTGGITTGSSGIGMGSGSGRTGTVTTSAPVRVSIPELTYRIRCHHGVPSTAQKGQLYDAARLRDILATQYNIDIDVEKPTTKQPRTFQVIE